MEEVVGERWRTVEGAEKEVEVAGREVEDRGRG